MGLKCRICASSSADLVNADLVRGQSVRDTAAKYSFSRSGTDRHARRCLPKVLAAYAVPEQTVADELRGLWQEAQRLKQEAERGGDLRVALVGLRQLADLLVLKMRAVETRAGLKEQVNFVIRYDHTPTASKPELSDAEIAKQLGALARRTKSEAVMACCAKLAFLLRRKPVPVELETIERKVLPQLPAPEADPRDSEQ